MVCVPARGPTSPSTPVQTPPCVLDAPLAPLPPLPPFPSTPPAPIPPARPSPSPFTIAAMAQQLGPVASVLLKLPGMTALARRAAASYQAAVGTELRKYGTLQFFFFPTPPRAAPGAGQRHSWGGEMTPPASCLTLWRERGQEWRCPSPSFPAAARRTFAPLPWGVAFTGGGRWGSQGCTPRPGRTTGRIGGVGGGWGFGGDGDCCGVVRLSGFCLASLGD